MDTFLVFHDKVLLKSFKDLDLLNAYTDLDHTWIDVQHLIFAVRTRIDVQHLIFAVRTTSHIKLENKVMDLELYF